MSIAMLSTYSCVICQQQIKLSKQTPRSNLIVPILTQYRKRRTFSSPFQTPVLFKVFITKQMNLLVNGMHAELTVRPEVKTVIVA